jgi:glycosyltransferase involved in cell wall biosynthesis
MRICFFGTYTLAAGYPVNRVLRDGLRRAGHDVVECRVEAWGPFVHRALSLRRPWRAIALGLRLVRAWLRLWIASRACQQVDWVIVGYPGFLDVHLARRLFDCPVALVSFISLYDTLVSDRGKVSGRGPGARLLHRLDAAAFRRADRVFVDTNELGDYYASLFDVERTRFVRSVVGEHDDDFAAAPSAARAADEPLRVLFFGTYVPLHGVETIVDAAGLLRDDEDIQLRLIGNGQRYVEMRQRASEAGVDAEFIDTWVPPEELVGYIAEAHVCLGVFGTTAKAGRVIPYKVFDAAAVGRAIVTRDSAAIRELFRDGESALLTPAGDAPALAAALRRLRDDDGLRLSLAREAQETYRRHGAPEAVGRTAAGHLQAAGSAA